MDPSQKSIAILCIFSFQIWTQTWAMAPVVPRFTYYHRDNPTKALTLEDVKKLPNPPKDLTVFIHGSNAENLEASGIIDFKDNFFEKVTGHDLTMVIDYTPTHIAKYMSGIEGKNSAYWGEQLAGELSKAVGELGIPPSKMDLIPYSLGNAVAAHAGRKFQEMGHEKLNSIIGLDPPDTFMGNDNILKSGDAADVTKVHTSIVGGNGELYGDKDIIVIPRSHPSLGGNLEVKRNHRAALDIGMDYLSGEIKDKCTEPPLVFKLGDTEEDKFRESLKKYLKLDELQTINYPTKSLDLNSEEEVEYLIDPAVKDLEFNFQGGSDAAQVEITDPRGDVLKDYEQDDHQSFSYKVEYPTPGEFSVGASLSFQFRRKKRDLDNKTITIQVSALPDLDAPSWPVFLEAGLSNSTVQPQNNELIAVYGMLTKEVDQVLGATLEATIISPEGNKTKLKLYDDGLGADFMKDDGIYSRFIDTPLEKDERYNIFVTATCPKGTCTLSTGDNEEAVKVEPFEREAVAGSLRSLQAYKPPPPAPVNDLNVVDYDPSEKVVVLTWTAMGESADSDVKAAGMEMRWAVFNGTGFSIWQKLDESLIYGESMSGVPRELQRARVHFPEEYVTQDEEKHCIYFTLRYHNSGGEFGGESNSVTPCDWVPPEGNILQIVLILALVVLAMAGATYTCFRYKMYVLFRPNFFSSAGTAEQSEPLLPSGAVL